MGKKKGELRVKNGKVKNKKMKILIADNQTAVREKLVSELEKDSQMQIIGTVDNGRDAYLIYEKDKPDIIVFDLLLPIYDGYALLEKIRECDINNDAKLIMTTPITSDTLVIEAFNRGVDYVLAKPYDVSILAEKIRRIYSRMIEVMKVRDKNLKVGMLKRYVEKGSDSVYENVETLISNRLNELEVPARLKGYRYIITAVKEVLKNEDALEAVTKVLYPDVARQHKSTPQRVEKAIRHAIEVTWNDNENNRLKREFGAYIREGKTRPTNSEFLAKLTQQIKQSQNKIIA